MRKRRIVSTVVHVSSAHPFTDNRIHYRECVSLAEAGFHVRLIAVESLVHPPPSPVLVSHIPRRSRIPRMLYSSMEAVYLALRSRSKIVHLHDPELIPYIPLLRLSGRIVVFDAHEDLPVQVLNKPYLRPGVAKAAAVLARALVKVAASSHAIICATEAIAERFPPHKTTVVHNYPPLRQAEAAATSDDINERARRLVYVGAVSEIRGALPMIASMSEPSMPSGWELAIAGAGPSRLLDAMHAMDGWARTEFHGQVDPERARDLILSARVGLVLFADSPAHRDALPTKMFEYFAAGVPVIASDFPLWRSIVLAENCGLLVDPASPAQVAQAVKRYADDPALLTLHSRNARRLAEERLNWDIEAHNLIGVYVMLGARR